MVNKEYNYAIGRRKCTTAVVKLYSQGGGTFIVKTASGKELPLKEYFGGNTYLYENAIAPFSVIAPEAYKKFDAHIHVLGGGIAGHSDAIKL